MCPRMPNFQVSLLQATAYVQKSNMRRQQQRKQTSAKLAKLDQVVDKRGNCDNPFPMGPMGGYFQKHIPLNTFL